MSASAPNRAGGRRVLDDDAYRDLVERLPAVVYLAEPGADGHWFYVSTQIVPMLGFTPREWVADPTLWASRIHPDDRERVVKAEEAFSRRITLSPGDVPPVRQVYRMLTRDGRIIWIQDDAYFVPGREGDPGYLRGLLLDVTAQKELELDLRAREERLRAVVDNVSDVLYSYRTTPEPRYDFISPAVEALSGYRPEEFYADPDLWLRIVHPDDLPELRAAFATTFTETFRCRWIHRDGRVILCEARNTPLTGADGELVGFAGLLRDVTSESNGDTHA